MHFYICCIFSLLKFYQCIAQERSIGHTEKKSNIFVGDILNKINKISIQSISDSPHDGKLEVLGKLENNLSKAAKSFGRKGEEYVKLIMKGVKARAGSLVGSLGVPVSENITQLKENNDSIINDNLILALAKNLENLTKSKFATILSEGRHVIKEVIKQKILESIRKKNSNAYNNTKEPQSYDNSIDERIDIILEKLFNTTRRVNTTNKENNENLQPKNDIVPSTTTENYIQLLTPGYECESVVDRTCLDIKEMKQLKCRYEDSVVSVEKLCNGYVDCPDRTDEMFCTSQVTERIHNANRVIAEVDESFERNCFPKDSGSFLMSTQNIIFRDVLKAQEDFVEKYKYLNWTILPNVTADTFKTEGNVKRTVNEISLVISTLALTLDATLCSKRASEYSHSARKFSDLFEDDFRETVKEVEWPPKSCKCVKGRCKNDTCIDSCKRVCWQKHSLTQWSCESINKTENVPMNTICDGKFDCLDESDEKGCVTGVTFAKFEAHEIFVDVLNIVSAKLSSKEITVRNLYVSLHHLISKLQKASMASDPDLKMISKLRNEYFSTLSAIYSAVLSKSTFLYDTEESYLLLLSLNEKIVTALKRSHTGNTRIIANDGCYCRNARCSMPLCSRKCTRVCVAEPILTRYICDGDSTNKSIPVDAICNGQPNCPLEDDEANCKEEVCRQHHLTVLRRSLKKIGKKQEGTAMGEMLEKWKTKTSSTLMVTEYNGRPTLIILRDVIKGILSDLVMTYGSVEDYKRSNEYGLAEFSAIAQHVMQAIKSCGK